MERKITCIICPRGCAMTATIADSGVTVTGHTCPKGEEYAINECTNPVRTVTAAVRVENRYNTMVSVKTDAPVPKNKMMEVMELVHTLRVQAPVAIGDVIATDVFGANLVITKDVI